MVKFLLACLACIAFILGTSYGVAQASNFLTGFWYAREVPPNTINGKSYEKVELPEGEAVSVKWKLDQGLGGFHLEPTSENANTERFPAGQPEFTCTSVEGTAEVENPRGGGEGIMNYKTMNYSGCSQKGYCAPGETIGLEQEVPITSSGVYMTKGFAHSHDPWKYFVKCNGVQVSTVSGPPLNLFWNEQGAGTHEGAEPDIPLTDTPENNKRYWEPAAELGYVNELELGELTDSLSSKEMLIRGQLGYLASDEDVLTIQH